MALHFKNTINRLKENKFLTDVLTLSSSQVLMYALPFVVTPILSRIYTPEDFGEWGVFSSLYSILSVVICACYEYAIVKSRDEEVGSLCWICAFISFIMIAICGIAFAAGYALGITFLTSFPATSLFFAYLFSTAINTVLNNLANRLGAFKILATCSILTGIGQASLRIVFGLIGLCIHGLIAGTVFANLLGSTIFLLMLFPHVKSKYQFRSNIKNILIVVNKYKTFPLYDVPATFLDFVSLNIPLLILSVVFSKSEIGCYSIVLQLLVLPISLVGTAIGRVYYQRLSNTKSINEIHDISLSISNFMVWLSVLPTIFLVLGGDQLLEMFLGAKWHNAASVSLCLAIWSIPNILTQPMLYTYRYFNRQKTNLSYNLLNLIITVGIICLGCHFHFSLYIILALYSLSGAIIKTLMYIDILKSVHVVFSEIYNFHKLFLMTSTFSLLCLRLYNILS